ncbi:MAG: hypothetical protein M5R41_06495 [Bacteroidia bacterium]|nr:hypothetical protein [Bacteroidia bacterium]
MVRKSLFLAAFTLFMLTLAVSTVHAQSARQVLLEEFSTAQCGFCPDGDIIAAQIVKDHPSVIWVTHHAGFGVDSMTAPGSATVASAFVNFAPSGVIDRTLFPLHVAPYANLGTIRSKWDSLVTARLGDEQFCDIRITSTYYAEVGQIDCTLEVEFSRIPSPGDFRLNLFVIEDSIVGMGKGYDQVNYFNGTPGHPYSGAGNPIIGYAHHNVVSAIPTGAWGVSGVIPATPETGTVYRWNWSSGLHHILDRNNFGLYDLISFVAFVSYHHEDPLQRRVVHAGQARITNVVLGTGEEMMLPRQLTLSAWPNPTHDRITIEAALLPSDAGMLLVTDAAGREMCRMSIHGGNPRQTLDTERFSGGMYFCRVITPRGVAGGTFLVLK